MPPKPLLAAIACGLGAAIALRMHLSRLEERVAGGPATEVLALTADLEAGALVTRESVTIRPLPQAYRESRHITAGELEHILGAQLAVDARASEHLLWTDLVSMRPGVRQLSGLVPHGRRAMTLRDMGGSSDALVVPGDRIDVLRSVEPGGGRRAELIVEDLLVLAVGRNLGGPTLQPREASAPARGGSITVSVTPEQSKVLAEAELAGALRFVLRNPDDVTLNDPRASLSAGHEVSP